MKGTLGKSSGKRGDPKRWVMHRFKKDSTWKLAKSSPLAYEEVDSESRSHESFGTLLSENGPQDRRTNRWVHFLSGSLPPKNCKAAPETDENEENDHFVSQFEPMTEFLNNAEDVWDMSPTEPAPLVKTNAATNCPPPQTDSDTKQPQSDDEPPKDDEEEVFFLPEGYIGRFRSYTEPLFDNIDWALSPISEADGEDNFFQQDNNGMAALDIIQLKDSLDEASSTKWVPLHHEDLVLSTESLDRSVEISMERDHSVGAALKISLQSKQSEDCYEDSILNMDSVDQGKTPSMDVEDSIVDVQPITPHNNNNNNNNNNKSGEECPIAIRDTKSIDQSIEVDIAMHSENSLVYTTFSSMWGKQSEMVQMPSKAKHCEKGTKKLDSLPECTNEWNNIPSSPKIPASMDTSTDWESKVKNSGDLTDSDCSFPVLAKESRAMLSTRSQRRTNNETNKGFLGRLARLHTRAPLKKPQTQKSVSSSINHKKGTIESMLGEESEDQTSGYSETEMSSLISIEPGHKTASTLKFLNTYRDDKQNTLWVAMKPPELMDLEAFERCIVEKFLIEEKKSSKLHSLRGSQRSRSARGGNPNCTKSTHQDTFSTETSVVSLTSYISSVSDFPALRGTRISKLCTAHPNTECPGIEKYSYLFSSLYNDFARVSSSIQNCFRKLPFDKTGKSVYNAVEGLANHPYTTEFQKSASHFGNKLEKIVDFETEEHRKALEDSLDEMFTALSNSVTQFQDRVMSSLSTVAKRDKDFTSVSFERMKDPGRDTDGSQANDLECEDDDWPKMDPTACKNQQRSARFKEDFPLSIEVEQEIEVVYAANEDFCLVTNLPDPESIPEIHVLRPHGLEEGYEVELTKKEFPRSQPRWRSIVL